MLKHRNEFVTSAGARAQADSLLADIDAALDLARMTVDAPHDCERRASNTARVREAYDTVLRLSRRFRFTSQQRRTFHARLDELKSVVARLGEERNRAA